jgi:hypothetical protein
LFAWLLSFLSLISLFSFVFSTPTLVAAVLQVRSALAQWALALSVERGARPLPERCAAVFLAAFPLFLVSATDARVVRSGFLEEYAALCCVVVFFFPGVVTLFFLFIIIFFSRWLGDLRQKKSRFSAHGWPVRVSTAGLSTKPTTDEQKEKAKVEKKRRKTERDEHARGALTSAKYAFAFSLTVRVCLQCVVVSFLAVSAFLSSVSTLVCVSEHQPKYESKHNAQQALL